MITLKNIHFAYEKNSNVLEDLSLEIEENSLNVILGENGSGKSTLLSILKGIEKIDSGEYYLFGKKIEKSDIKYSGYIHDIGFVFQDPDAALVGLDVKSDIEFGPLNMGIDGEELDFVVKEAMTSCDIMHLQDKNPYLLSFGEKKRVTIAGVLAMKPRILLLDEPTTYLDPSHKVVLFNILKKAHENGTTIILTTHDLEFAKELNCRYIFVKNKKIYASGDLSVFSDNQLLEDCKLI